LDRSEAMIAHASSVNPEVRYLLGDMLAARLGGTSFQELEACFVSAAEHLAPGGALLCLPEQIKEQFKQHRVRSQTHAKGDLSVTTVEVDFDPDPLDDWFETTFAYFIREGGELRVELDTHWNGVFPLATFALAAESAGLRVEAVEIPLSDMPPDEPYILLVGRKL
jgi:hypothetical protein